mgnify:CR=1 FL=1
MSVQRCWVASLETLKGDVMCLVAAIFCSKALGVVVTGEALSGISIILVIPPAAAA